VQKIGLASVEMGGRRVPVRGVAQCRVCSSDLRIDIERALAEGQRPTEIVRRLPEGSRITVRNVTEHRRRGHLPPDHEAVREVAEKAALGLRNAQALAVATEATRMVLAKEVVRRVSEKLATGEIQPTIRDGVRCARFLLDAEVKTREFDRMEARIAVRAVLAHVKRMDEDLYRHLLVAIEDDHDTIGLRQVGPLRLP
jgi:hypothetical protein